MIMATIKEENAPTMLSCNLVPCIAKYFLLYSTITQNKAVKDKGYVEMIRNNMTKAIGISIASVIFASVLALSLPVASPVASAQAVTCGDTITQSLKLTADIGPCSGDGITIGADNITLDCNGHTVSGSGTGSTGTGITVPAGISGVTIRNCQVTEFGIGFSVFGPSNTLLDNTARHNGGPGFNIGGVGDTILLDNTARHNGGSGFSIFADSTNNNLEGNTARHNGGDGFFLSDTSINNSLKDNKANNNLSFGYADDSFLNDGTGTAGTENIYIGNKCSGNGAGGSSPTGLCKPQA
jgi:parallel beta-helix repeat protein